MDGTRPSSSGATNSPGALEAVLPRRPCPSRLGGAAITIYDPTTVDSAGIRSPFPGNVIPKFRMDPVALNLLKYWPNPNNIPTNAFTFANNFATQGKSKNTDNKFDSRIDHYFNSKIRMFL